MKNTVRYIISLVMILTCVMVVVSGGTYAYWKWTSDIEKNVVFNTSGGIENYVVYNEGNSYFVGDFQPKSTFCQSANTTLSFYKTSEVSDVELSATIYMDVNSIESNIAASNDVYWIITKGDSNISCSSGLDTALIINYGTFNGMESGKTLTLTSNLEVKTTVQTFTVWIWIDSSGSNLSSLTGETVDTNIWTQIDMLHSEPAMPELDSGMIPVVISNDGTVTTVSQDNPDWYSYSDKRWANSILVTSDSRSKYIGTAGVEVTQTDILAYYVWIPRYKYRIWTTGVSTTGGEQTIDIIFEDKTAAMVTGTKVGEYRTHPAFWWDDNSDGVVATSEMIAGIWVSKFEGSGSSSLPKILPGVTPLNTRNISTMFTISLLFSGGSQTGSTVTFVGNNTYGLSSSVDSHMIKGRDWGAVAYLSHSIYGINNEVRINNNSSYTTGCGASTVNGANAESCEIAYGSGVSEYPQSTTGNITGIFDMSGGQFEYVMGVMSDSEGNPRAGGLTGEATGFNGYNADGTYVTDGIDFPDSKYYDLFLRSQFSGTNLTNVTYCDIETCGGYALNETAGWYSDQIRFPTETRPWLGYGGYQDEAELSGLFRFGYNYGNGGKISFRSVLVIK